MVQIAGKEVPLGILEGKNPFLPLKLSSREEEYKTLEESEQLRKLDETKREAIKGDMNKGHYLKEAVYRRAPEMYRFMYPDDPKSKEIAIGAKANAQFFRERVSNSPEFQGLDEKKQKLLYLSMMVKGYQNPDAIVKKVAPEISDVIDFTPIQGTEKLYESRNKGIEKIQAEIRGEAREEEKSQLSPAAKKLVSVHDVLQQLAVHGSASYIDTALFNIPSSIATRMERKYDVDLYIEPETTPGKIGSAAGSIAGFFSPGQKAVFRFSGAKGSGLLAAVGASGKAGKIIGSAAGTGAAIAAENMVVRVGIGDKPFKEALTESLAMGAFATVTGAAIGIVGVKAAEKLGSSHAVQAMKNSMSSGTEKRYISKMLTAKVEGGGKDLSAAQISELIQSDDVLKNFYNHKPWMLARIVPDEQTGVAVMESVMTPSKAFKGDARLIYQAARMGDQKKSEMLTHLVERFNSKITANSDRERSVWRKIHADMEQRQLDIDDLMAITGKETYTPRAADKTGYDLVRQISGLTASEQQHVMQSLHVEKQFYKTLGKFEALNDMQQSRAWGRDPVYHDVKRGALPDPYKPIIMEIQLNPTDKSLPARKVFVQTNAPTVRMAKKHYSGPEGYKMMLRDANYALDKEAQAVRSNKKLDNVATKEALQEIDRAKHEVKLSVLAEKYHLDGLPKDITACSGAKVKGKVLPCDKMNINGVWVDKQTLPDEVIKTYGDDVTRISHGICPKHAGLMYELMGKKPPATVGKATPKMLEGNPTFGFYRSGESGKPFTGIPNFLEFDPVDLMEQKAHQLASNASYDDMKMVWNQFKTHYAKRLDDMSTGKLEKYVKAMLDEPGPRAKRFDQAYKKLIDSSIFGEMPVLRDVASAASPSTLLLGKVRNMTTILKLGFFNQGSAVVNYTSGVTNLYIEKGPALARRGFINSLNPSDVEKRLYSQLGIKNAGSLKLDVYKPGKPSKAIMYMFSKAEELVRRQTISTSVADTLKKNPHATFPELKQAAMELLDKTQFHYGTSNRPGILRSPLGATVFQFKTYPVNQMQFLLGKLASGDHRAIRRMLIGLAVGGGIMGLPFVEDIDDLIFATTGKSPLKAAESKLPDPVMYGIAGAIGVNMGQKLGVGSSFMPKSAVEAVTPPLVSSVQRAATAEDPLKAVTAMAPGVGGPLEAGRALATGDKSVRTYAGRPVTELTAAEWIAKGLGFPSVAERKARQFSFYTQREEEQISKELTQAAKDDDLDAFVNIYSEYGLDPKYLEKDWLRLTKVKSRQKTQSRNEQLLGSSKTRNAARRAKLADQMNVRLPEQEKAPNAEEASTMEEYRDMYGSTEKLWKYNYRKAFRDKVTPVKWRDLSLEQKKQMLREMRQGKRKPVNPDVYIWPEEYKIKRRKKRNF